MNLMELTMTVSILAKISATILMVVEIAKNVIMVADIVNQQALILTVIFVILQDYSTKIILKQKQQIQLL